MATTAQPLKYLWTAYFEDGLEIQQPANDRYSKHDDEAEWNPSAFRDVLEAQEKGNKLTSFELTRVYGYAQIGEVFWVNLEDGRFAVSNDGGLDSYFKMEDEPLTDRKLIYHRIMRQEFTDGEPGEPFVHQYAIGYEGKDSDGKVHKHIIYVDG